jgi:orotate phosphoribosyltransferase
MFNQQAFNEFIIEQGIIGFYDSPITLKSGKQSTYYVNWRSATADVHAMERISQFVIDFALEKKLNPDVFVGVPEGASALGIVTQLAWAKSSPSYSKKSHHFAMVRAKPKEHGHPQDRHCIGSLEGKLVLLEDVTTTGMSLIATYNELKKIGCDIIACIGLTNRNDKDIHSEMAALGCMYFQMSSSKEIIESLIKSGSVPKALISKLNEELGLRG